MTWEWAAYIVSMAYFVLGYVYGRNREKRMLLRPNDAPMPRTPSERVARALRINVKLTFAKPLTITDADELRDQLVAGIKPMLYHHLSDFEPSDPRNVTHDIDEDGDPVYGQFDVSTVLLTRPMRPL